MVRLGDAGRAPAALPWLGRALQATGGRMAMRFLIAKGSAGADADALARIAGADSAARGDDLRGR